MSNTSTESFPPEVKALGIPERVFKMGGLHNFLKSGDLSDIHGGWLIAGVFPILAVACVMVYLFAPPPSDAPAEVWLIVAGVCLLIGIIGGVLAFLGIGGKKTDAGSDPKKAYSAAGGKRHGGYLLYKNAIVAMEPDGPRIAKFQDVAEVQMPAMTGASFVFKTKDGTQLALIEGVEEYESLLPIVIDRVKAHLLPIALKKIADGQAAEFGVFKVSRRGISYKGDETPWTQVTNLEIQSGKVGRRLTIHNGGMTAWCWHDLNTVPNCDVLYDVICRVAPKHLLKVG